MIALLHLLLDKQAYVDRDWLEQDGHAVTLVPVDATRLKASACAMLHFTAVAIPDLPQRHSPGMKQLTDIALLAGMPVNYVTDLRVSIKKKPTPAAAAAVPPSQQTAAVGNTLPQLQDNQLTPQ